MQLDGVRILDLTRLLPGPYATQLLADSGAEVIKVEDTGAGDYARHGQPRSERDVGAIFEMVNRGKKSVSLDLKSDEGTEAFYRLVESADVVFEQFRPGVVDRLGIDYETLRSYNEELIYCSLTGYGQDGPWADRAGHDLNYVGLAGLLDMTRESPEDKPQMPGYPIGDMGGGLFSAFAITEALLSRELGNTGGEYIDVAMSDVVASFSQSVTYQALTGDPAEPRPGQTALSGTFPWYDSYETADGEWVTLAALEPKFWRAFCEAVDKEHLIDAHEDHDPETFAAVAEELEALFAERTREEWEDALGDVDAAFGGVYSPAEMVEHPQLNARDLVERPDDAPPRIGFPARSSETPAETNEDLPAQGEHTESLLSAVGYSDGELEELREADAIR
ncbi:CaiB/BaiF CoA transferase family protein [Natronolimnohabitans innermongolicus]|uniref:L-carnitine dehydratase/bile acid-inducible protein F n=1 Tax=Natronolimnohabitans innermongolicus JCM 12255 TaxID=1227499 RepID=L9WME3_9EURY|nr:CaiB/BaiF CoA-transferase family protein [Natronolimnohabitans innermongolicus]ELY50401.1 L-carnitine dehydratase/bile acid-inducible protein F [Natronolimnohabitans innermongolicus JCM 12255]